MSMKTAKPSRLTSLATVLLIPLALGLFAVQLSAQTTTLYSTTFAGGTMDGWTIPISSDHNYMTEVPVGYAVTPDTHFGSSANIYSPSIDLTGYTSGYSINLSFGLADALSTNPALVIGIGGAPNPGNPFGWFINSPDTFSIV